MQSCDGIVPSWRVRILYRVLSGNRKEPAVEECQKWWVLRSTNQARLEGGLAIVIEALNFERRSLPRIRVGHFGSMRKEWENGVS